MTIVLLHFLSKINFNLNTSKIVYYFLILLAMLMTYSASSQVTADFSTMDSTSACGSLIVEFQDLSIGNPNSWLWDLGNGKISNLKYTILLNTKLPYIYYEVNLMR
jgi:PKD repeat protein